MSIRTQFTKDQVTRQMYKRDDYVRRWEYVLTSPNYTWRLILDGLRGGQSWWLGSKYGMLPANKEVVDLFFKAWRTGIFSICPGNCEQRLLTGSEVDKLIAELVAEGAEIEARQLSRHEDGSTCWHAVR
jgi:hypothetical protein